MKNSGEIEADNEVLFERLRNSNKVEVLGYCKNIGLKMPKNISKLDALECIKNHYSFINLSLRMSERC